jgi:DNA-binding MarR family transcriptional regulator
MGDTVLDDMVRDCLLARTRLVARVLTGIYDDVLMPFEIGAPQFVLLVGIYKLAPATRAAIGRFAHQDRSTLTRNMKLLLAGGWVEEVDHAQGARSRPIVLTAAGRDLLHAVAPAWRAAQEKARTVLGDEGAVVMMRIGNALFDQSAK